LFFKEYLGERGKRGSILQNRCRSSISTPWCLQSLTHTRFGGLDSKIAPGRDEGERGATGVERGCGQTVKGVKKLTAVKRVFIP
jgi:hypothetical protein